ncbi:hypothetical protein G9P44_000433 [Scheffersomyces stipitis]|nr:hypothetical protein G9P44_000433 [Scheffersomyces stipitis]
MPLDLHSDTEHSVSITASPPTSTAIYTLEELAELRVSLIGNKDLKFKKVGDVRFIQALVSDVQAQISQILMASSASADSHSHPLNNLDFLEQLEKKAVVVNILCSFISEVNTNKHENITTCLRSLEEVVAPIIQLLNYFVDTFIPSLASTSSSPTSGSADQDKQDTDNRDIISKIETLMNYFLDIFLNLANIHNHNISSDRLWKFIICLLIVGETSEHSVANWNLLTKSLKLVPILLSNARIDYSSSITSIITLLTALLKRLSRECDVIVATHFPQVANSPELLHQLAFEDSNLPNIELNRNIIRTNINPSLLNGLITCTAQIFSFFKANDYDILMASPTGSSVSASSATTLTTSTASKNTVSRSSVVVLSISVYLSLLLLVKYDDRFLNLSALNLIFFYLNNLRPSNELNDNLIYKNYTKLFPKIIEMLELDNEISKKNLSDSKKKESKIALDLPMYLFSPGRILADLCAQYPLLNDEIKDANIDLNVVKNLEASFKSSHLLKVLRALKKNSNHGKAIVDFTVLLSTPRDDSVLADLLLLLSVYTSSTEDYRHRVINYASENSKSVSLLPQIIFEIIDNYHFLLTQIQLNYRLLYPRKRRCLVPKKDLPWFGRNLGIVRTLLDSSVYTNCFYLVRSLSRSVSSLRTFFVECNSISSFVSEDGCKDVAGGLITNFLQILKCYESSDQISDFFNNLNKNVDVNGSYYLNKRAKMTNKAASLGILANFILDFSALRYSIVNYDNFLQSLSVIFQNASTSVNVGSNNDKLTDEDIYQKNVIQLNTLHVVKNFMFNETNENKKELLDYFPLIFLFQKTVYGLSDYNQEDPIEIRNLKLQQKLVAFGILRNFTAASPSFNAILANSYEQEFISFAQDPNLPAKWADFIVATIKNVNIFTDLPGSIELDDEFLTGLILNDDYVDLVSAINYLEDHKYTSIDRIKKSQFPRDVLLKLWIRFLSLTPSETFLSKLDLNEKINLSTNLNEIKLSIVWIIINLTWKYSTYGFDVREGANYNLFDTVDGYNLRPGSLPTRRIMVEDSDDDDANEIAEQDISMSNLPDELSVRDRALYLHRFGFSDVLVKLINLYSKQFETPAPVKEKKSRYIGEITKKGSIAVENKLSNNDKSPAPKRFDIQNSHDLLENLKKANHQIMTLLRGGGRVTNKPSGRVSDAAVSVEVFDEVSRRVRRPSGVVSSGRIQRPDVNRGGEGFGYDSDDYNAGERESHSSDTTSVDDQEMENAENRGDDEGEDESEEPREYWVM